MKVESKTSITRRTDCEGNHSFCIEIKCDSSGLLMTRTFITAELLSLALSGFSSQPSETEFIQCNAANFGKEREVQTISCDMRDHDKEMQRKYVAAHFAESGLANEGWEIHSDGTNTQQNGIHHRYTIKRFVDKNQESKNVV